LNAIFDFFQRAIFKRIWQMRLVNPNGLQLVGLPLRF